MIKRFVLSTSSLNNSQEAAIIAELDRKGLGWWHWLPNTWLIVSYDGASNEIIRDAVRPLIGNAECLIVEVQGFGWAGLTLTRNGKKMDDWLGSVWKGD